MIFRLWGIKRIIFGAGKVARRWFLETAVGTGISPAVPRTLAATGITHADALSGAGPIARDASSTECRLLAGVIRCALSVRPAMPEHERSLP